MNFRYRPYHPYHPYRRILLACRVATSAALLIVVIGASLEARGIGRFGPLASDPGIPDTLRVANVTAPMGSQLVVPVYFFCDENLGGMQVTLRYSSTAVVCDSVSFVGSSVSGGSQFVTIDSAARTINSGVLYVGENIIPPQSGLFARAFFSPIGLPAPFSFGVDSISIAIDSVTAVRTTFGQSNPAVSIFPAFVAGVETFQPFTAGDVDGSGAVNIGDPVALVAYIFLGGPPPTSPPAADADGSCSLDIGDAIYLISFIFLGGPAPLPGCA